MYTPNSVSPVGPSHPLPPSPADTPTDVPPVPPRAGGGGGGGPPVSVQQYALLVSMVCLYNVYIHVHRSLLTDEEFMNRFFILV